MRTMKTVTRHIGRTALAVGTVALLGLAPVAPGYWAFARLLHLDPNTEWLCNH